MDADTVEWLADDRAGGESANEHAAATEDAAAGAAVATEDDIPF